MIQELFRAVLLGEVTRFGVLVVRLLRRRAERRFGWRLESAESGRWRVLEGGLVGGVVLDRGGLRR